MCQNGWHGPQRTAAAKGQAAPYGLARGSFLSSSSLAFFPKQQHSILKGQETMHASRSTTHFVVLNTQHTAGSKIKKRKAQPISISVVLVERPPLLLLLLVP